MYFCGLFNTQFLFKYVYFMHFLPHFWVKIGSKMIKMHRFYIKTCVLVKQEKYTFFHKTHHCIYDFAHTGIAKHKRVIINAKEGFWSPFSTVPDFTLFAVLFILIIFIILLHIFFEETYAKYISILILTLIDIIILTFMNRIICNKDG